MGFNVHIFLPFGNGALGGTHSMRINKDMRQRKRRLNKTYQWWLGTAPSGLELAGEADSPAKVYIL